MLSFRIMSFRYVPDSFSAYHDNLVSVLLKSPNRFTSFDDTPVDQQEALREAFDVLQEAFPLVEKKLKDDYLVAVLRELLRMAYEFFSGGDDRNGMYALQEVEGTVWPSRKVPPRHAPDAERRAHGKLERYAGVIPNPYPYLGKIEDMGRSQLKLYQAVLNAYEDGSGSLEAGKVQNWLLGLDGVARRFHERSRKGATARFTRELAERTSLAALRVEGGFSTSLTFDVEELGCCRISVRGKLEAFKARNPNYIVEEAYWTVKPNM